MTDYIDPMKEFREQQERMEELMDPMKKIREQMDPMKKIREQMDPMKKIREQMDPMKEFREQHKRIEEGMRSVNIFDQINIKVPAFDNSPLTRSKLLEDRQRWLDISEALLGTNRLESMRSMSAALGTDRARYLDDTVSLYKKISDAAESHRSLFADISIQDDVAIVSGEAVDLAKLDSDIEAFSEESQSPEEFFNSLLSFAEQLVGPTKTVFLWIIDKIIITFILGIAINLATPIFQDWPERYFGTEPRVERKQIIREAKELYFPHELEGHRFVVAKSGLFVRHIGNKSGDVIGGISFGTVVEIIEKNRDWSLVEYYESGTGEIVQGWVFTRFLKKFE